jgi:Uncharacterized conserved protein (DUF2183)
VKEFLLVSQLPPGKFALLMPLPGTYDPILPGSIRLKSYTGRSLFNGLLSAPASRKRAGVVEVLDAFPASRFILIGDTGEQDLELYATLAAERPTQIAGVFVRDASTSESSSGSDSADSPDTTMAQRTGSGSIEDPTGSKALGQSPPDLSEAGPKSASEGYFTTGPLSAEPEAYATSAPVATSSSSSSSGSGTKSVTPSGSPRIPPSRLSPSVYSLSSGASRLRRSSLPEQERRRIELQTRVWRARTLVPVHIPLRIFRKPEECVEAWEILERM